MSAWNVRIAQHTVEGSTVSYEIEEREWIVSASKREEARIAAVRDAHIRAKVPPWKPYARQSWPHTSAWAYVDIKMKHPPKEPKR